MNDMLAHVSAFYKNGRRNTSLPGNSINLAYNTGTRSVTYFVDDFFQYGELLAPYWNALYSMDYNNY